MTELLNRAKAALRGITEGPWATNGVLIGCELVKESPGVTSYKYAIGEMDEDSYDEEGGQGEYDGEAWRPHEQMLADAEFIATARTLVPELVAELERYQRGGRTLGEQLDRTLRDIIAATDSHDLIGEDGDGDWMIVFERLAELRPDRDEALGEVERCHSVIAELRRRDESSTGVIEQLRARIRGLEADTNRRLCDD